MQLILISLSAAVVYCLLAGYNPWSFILAYWIVNMIKNIWEGWHTATSTKKLCADYLGNKLRIKRLMEDPCYVTDTVMGSSDEAPYLVRPMTISGVDGLKRSANRREIERLAADCAFVEATISMAPNSMVRYAMECKYFDNLDWPEVATRVNLGGFSATADSVRMAVYRYLDSVDRKRKGKQDRKGKTG